jgi:hypothetical protein
MATQKKLGDRGVAQWQQLETPGDVKRFLRWVILSVRSQTLDTRAAGVYSQLAMALLKAMQDSDFEERLTALEDALRATQQQNGAVTTY